MLLGSAWGRFESGAMTLAGTGGRSLNRLPPKNIIKERGKQNPRFFYGKGESFMAELSGLLPMPPHFGPPPSGLFKVTHVLVAIFHFCPSALK